MNAHKGETKSSHIYLKRTSINKFAFDDLILTYKQQEYTKKNTINYYVYDHNSIPI